MALTSAEIVAARLVRQQLSGTDLRTPAEIVQWFGAMQAQEYALTKWSIGLRLRNLTDVDVEKAFTDGQLLRTHLLRPTWHFVTPEDIRWMLALTAPHVQAGNAYMYRKMELDGRIFSRCNDVLAKILCGGRSLSRQQIAGHFKAGKIIADGIRLSLIMMQAELEGIICSGARAGNQFTYALLEERVPPMPTFQPDEALAELTLRYYTSRGPATIADFATWSGLKVKDVRTGIGMVRSQLSAAQIDGVDYYWSGRRWERTEEEYNEVHFLPPYDEYIMGYKSRADIRPTVKSRMALPRLLFDSMIIHEGRIAGSWRRTVAKKQISLEYHFIKPGTAIRKAFKETVSRFEAFAMLPIELIER